MFRYMSIFRQGAKCMGYPGRLKWVSGQGVVLVNYKSKIITGLDCFLETIQGFRICFAKKNSVKTISVKSNNFLHENMMDAFFFWKIYFLSDIFRKPGQYPHIFCAAPYWTMHVDFGFPFVFLASIQTS